MRAPPARFIRCWSCWKDGRPEGSSDTTSPSSTNGRSAAGTATSGYREVASLPRRDLSLTVEPSQVWMTRTPSHFSSYTQSGWAKMRGHWVASIGG